MGGVIFSKFVNADMISGYFTRKRGNVKIIASYIFKFILDVSYRETVFFSGMTSQQKTINISISESTPANNFLLFCSSGSLAL